MNWNLPEMHQAVLDEVRTFARAKLSEQASERDHAQALPAELMSELAELGLLGIAAPESANGAGLDALAYTLVVEEIARADGSVALMVANHAGPGIAALAGHAELSRAASGDALVSWSPDGELATNGSTAQIWIVGEEWSAQATSTPVKTLGCRAADRADVRLREAQPLASSNASVWHDLGLAAVALGRGEAAYEAGVAYAKERKQFKRPIADFQAIQWRIADSKVALEVARMAVRRAAFSLAASDCAGARVVAGESAQQACDHALQIHGGYGYTCEYPIERALRDVSVARSDATRAKSVIAATL